MRLEAMKIGTVRTEEARVYDSHAGYHQFHAPETQEPFGSFEVFWHDPTIRVLRWVERDALLDDWRESEPAGWYWAAGFPGCLFDGEPSGPFAYSYQAHQDADEWSPDYDD
jgi:hypothetical protein